MKYPYVFAWGNNPVRKERQYQRCRVLVRGALQSVLVEFEDGFLMVTSEKALRPATPGLFDLV